MDSLLKSAQVLYRDRQRIALAALIVLFSVTAFVLFGPIGQTYLAESDVPWFHTGWTLGTTVVYGLSTVMFLLAFSIMVFFYAFWSWAFLPSPAVAYTMGVLRGIFGVNAQISKRIGKQFRVQLSPEIFLEFHCRIRGAGSDEWFVYKVRSSPTESPDIQQIALHNGIHVEKGRLVTNIGNEELHNRILLLTRAITMIAPS